MSEIDDIKQVIADYNAAELEQNQRLEWLYKTLRDRAGGSRFISFGNSLRWGSNDFQKSREDIQLSAHVAPMIQYITDFNPGQDGVPGSGVAPGQPTPYIPKPRKLAHR